MLVLFVFRLQRSRLKMILVSFAREMSVFINAINGNFICGKR